MNVGFHQRSRQCTCPYSTNDRLFITFFFVVKLKRMHVSRRETKPHLVIISESNRAALIRFSIASFTAPS